MRGRWAVAVAITALLAVSCGDDSDRAGDDDETTETATAQTIDVVDRRGQASDSNYPEVDVRVIDNEFVDGEIRIDPGVTVAWQNDGRVEHNIVTVSEEPDFGVDTDAFGPGSEHEFRFTEPGVYPYYCSLHGTADAGMTGTIVVGDVPADLASAGPRTVPSGPPQTISVPTDVSTIQEAVDSAPPGSLVLVEPGTYAEAVVITTDRIVLRGLDRDESVLDGGGTLPNGVLVLADGVAIENLTARNYRVNGFFWNGVTGFRGSYLTAVDNVLYGVYAFDSTMGIFEHSYAAGSTDSGFYVGQCDPCDTLITDVVAENNQQGFSGANASVGRSCSTLAASSNTRSIPAAAASASPLSAEMASTRKRSSKSACSRAEP